MPRHIMLRSIAQQNIDANDVNIDLLLKGDEKYSLLINKKVFCAVHIFISESARL